MIESVEEQDSFAEQFARNRALSAILAKTRTGSVDGIFFDLRLSKIDPAEWEIFCPYWGDTGSVPSRTGVAPFIWCPWHGEFDAEKLALDVADECKSLNEYNSMFHPLPREAYFGLTDVEYLELLSIEQKEWESRKLEPAGRDWIASEIVNRTPDAILRIGDRVLIARAEMSLDEDEFLPVPDSAVINIFVKIAFTDGSIEELVNPIVMTHSAKITNRFGRRPFYSIMRRVRLHYSLETLSRKLVDATTRKSLVADSALNCASRLFETSLPKIERLGKSAGTSGKIARKYIEALDDACMLGYNWARAEAELNMKPLAELGSKSKAGARIGGAKSGESRRKTSEETWKPLAVKLAKNARKNDPYLSTERVIKSIQDAWSLAPSLLPAHSTLRDFISILEGDGLLPRKLSRKTTNERGSIS